MNQVGHSGRVHAVKLTGTRPPNHSRAVHYHICTGYKTTQAFSITEIAFYPMDVKTGEIVSF
jgi:hypothetical protein